MHIVFLTDKEKVAVTERPARREAGAGEVVIAPRLVGLTGIDVARFRAGAPLENGFRRPHIPGTEFVGRVLEVGRGVDPALAGRRVVANPISPCYNCAVCRAGSPNLCPNARMLGRPPTDGVLQEAFAWPAHLCMPVPDVLDDEQAIHLTPLSIAIHIVDRAEVSVGETVAVVGCGHLGQLLVELLSGSLAAQVMAVDLLAYRCAAARERGAAMALGPHDALEAAKALPRGGVDLAIDVSNASEGSREAVGLARIGGRVVVGGVPEDNRVIFSAIQARHKELTLQFTRRPYNTLERAVRLMVDGRLPKAHATITHRFPLAEVQQAYTTLRRYHEDPIKVVIEMPDT